MLVGLIFIFKLVEGFLHPPAASTHSQLLRSTGPTFSAANDDVSASLLNHLEAPGAGNAEKIRESINALESIKSTATESDDDVSRFEQVLGLYNVSFVQTIKQGENPVGGKWTRKSGLAQKFLRTRRTLQHVLAVNETGIGAQKVVDSNGLERSAVAEAVNVIALEALWGKIRTTILLRGDCIALNNTERVSDMCQPLSPLAVRVLFDAPRIVIGKTGRWFNFNLGPKSSVVLDTCYVDKLLRIGLGGRSGTRFVFARCAGNDQEANEFRGLLARKAWSKKQALSTFTLIGTIGLHLAISRGMKVIGGFLSTISLMTGLLFAFSSGGIEQDASSA